jgi:hypothetical protein
LKKKVITSINILGLSIGISAALVIYLIVQYDYSFDRYEPDGARIYRIVLHGEQWDNAGVPVPLPQSLAPVTGCHRRNSHAGYRPADPEPAGRQSRPGEPHQLSADGVRTNRTMANGII